MAPMRFVAALLLGAAVLFAQQGGGSVAGKLTDPSGDPIPSAFVQLKNTASGTSYQVTSSLDGSYRINGLPVGTYDLNIPSLGFQYPRTERKGIAVAAGAETKLDVRIEWGGNLGTPGDEFSIGIRSKHPAPAGPAPRTREGKPDFSGVWVGINTLTGQAPLQPWAAALAAERGASNGKDHPSNFCLPMDVIGQSAFVYKIVQTPELIVLLWEGNLPGVDQIFLDGRGHPTEMFPSWMGHSVGRWEGDTLVVDTVGFNDRSWLGVAPHTEQMHVVQRYSRTDLGHLVKEVTVTDPGAFTAPWTYRVNWELAPGEEIVEMVCESNNYPQHNPKN